MENIAIAFIGSLGGQELWIVLLLILLLFGAKKLPELARGIGKSMGEFKKARDEFEHEIMNAEQEAKSTPAEKPKVASHQEKENTPDS